jgi:hypothetical protein
MKNVSPLDSSPSKGFVYTCSHGMSIFTLMYVWHFNLKVSKEKTVTYTVSQTSFCCVFSSLGCLSPELRVTLDSCVAQPHFAPSAGLVDSPLPDMSPIPASTATVPI